MPFYDLVLKSSVRGFVATPLDDNRCGRYIDELAKYSQAWKDVLTRINEYNPKPWMQVSKMPRCQFHIHRVPTGEVTCLSDSELALDRLAQHHLVRIVSARRLLR